MVKLERLVPRQTDGHYYNVLFVCFVGLEPSGRIWEGVVLVVQLGLNYIVQIVGG